MRLPSTAETADVNAKVSIFRVRNGPAGVGAGVFATRGVSGSYALFLTAGFGSGGGKALLVTDHSVFPYPAVHEAASLLIDTRNAFGQRGLAGPHVVRA